jgi:hypothetical protein
VDVRGTGLHRWLQRSVAYLVRLDRQIEARQLFKLQILLSFLNRLTATIHKQSLLKKNMLKKYRELIMSSICNLFPEETL